MKAIKLFTFIIISLLSNSNSLSQTETVKGGLDHPIAMVFDNDRVYVALHGKQPHQGKIVSFDVNNAEDTYVVHFDNLSEYPRALALRNDILYIGFTTYIGMIDFNAPILEIEVLLSNLFFPRCFVFDDSRLYFGEDEKLSVIDVDAVNPSPTLLVDNLEIAPLSMALKDDIIYIATGKSIMKYDIAFGGQELEEFLPNFEHRIYSIVIIEGVLYIDQRNFVRYDLNDPTAMVEHFKGPFFFPIGLTYHEGHLYFASPEHNINDGIDGKILKVTEKIVLSEKSIENEPLKVYPNPTHGTIQLDGIEYENYTVTLRDQNGKTVLKTVNKDVLDLHDLIAGFYILELRYRDTNQIVQKKIIVSK